MEYCTYLKINELLSLQKPLSKKQSDNELLFIIVHQIIELLFKLQVENIKIALNFGYSGDITMLKQKIKRSNVLWETMIHSFAPLSTLLPQEFMKFRGHLGSASGIQSEQYKTLEKLLIGQKNGKSSLANLFVKIKTKNNGSDLIPFFLEFDRLFIEWKKAHLKIVTCMIGDQLGTGGKTQRYLKAKLNPIFDITPCVNLPKVRQFKTGIN